jgi:hypothetical protein
VVLASVERIGGQGPNGARVRRTLPLEICRDATKQVSGSPAAGAPHDVGTHRDLRAFYLLVVAAGMWDGCFPPRRRRKEEME